MKSKQNIFQLNSYSDYRTIGLFRTVLGIALLLDLFINRLPAFVELYTNEGFLTTTALAHFSSASEFSVLFYLTSKFSVGLFFIFYFLFCVLLTLGWNSKYIVVLLYYCFFSILERGFPFISGADTVLNLTLFWAIFLPLDNRYSFFNKRVNGSNEFRSWGVFAFFVQISVIYFFNSVFKSGDTWSDGTAVGYALSIYAHKAWLTSWLLNQPELAALLTYLVKWSWFFIPIFIFSPIYKEKSRLIAGLIICTFHYGIIPFLNVGTFYISVLPMLIFIIPIKYFTTLFPKLK